MTWRLNEPPTPDQIRQLDESSVRIKAIEDANPEFRFCSRCHGQDGDFACAECGGAGWVARDPDDPIRKASEALC